MVVVVVVVVVVCVTMTMMTSAVCAGGAMWSTSEDQVSALNPACLFSISRT